MTAKEEDTEIKIIHLAKIWKGNERTLLALYKLGDLFVWASNPLDTLEETDVKASSIQEALQLARKKWKLEGFTFINCGYRYTLPERDEHGIEALFYQMIESLSSMNGVYMDDELGHLCFVQNPSLEARNLLGQFKSKNLVK